jgi:glycosyltransferase involved in cell wall biosynthesis
MTKIKVSIVIPVLNERKSIPIFLRHLTDMTNQSDDNLQIIFVDNGSDDGSYELLTEYVKNLEGQNVDVSYKILSEPKKGKGRAVKKAIACTSGEYVVIIDADNEYNMVDFQKLLNVIHSQEADLVLGCRFTDKPLRKIPNQPLTSWYFNAGHSFFTWYFNQLFHKNLVDPATMWKMMRGDVVRSFKLTANTFNLDFELVASFAKLNKRIIEVPAQYSARSKSDGKKIKLVIDPMIWTVSFLRYWLRSPKNCLKPPTLEEDRLIS